MKAEDMKSLNFGDILVYDDGRPGHRGSKAEVLSNDKSHVVLQFEDRADTTTIKHDDSGWIEHLTKA